MIKFSRHDLGIIRALPATNHRFFKTTDDWEMTSIRTKLFNCNETVNLDDIKILCKSCTLKINILKQLRQDRRRERKIKKFEEFLNKLRPYLYLFVDEEIKFRNDQNHETI